MIEEILRALGYDTQAGGKFDEWVWLVVWLGAGLLIVFEW